MNSSTDITTLSLRLIDIVGPGIDRDKIDDIDPDLVPFGIQHGLVREVLPHSPGPPTRIHLTGLALEKSITLRDAGHPLIGLDITKYGLIFRADLTQPQWVTTLQRLRTVKQTYHTALADLLNYGRSRFGAEFVNSSVEQLEFSFEDIERATAVGRVPRHLREAFELTSEHSYILGLKFPNDPTNQELWAARAREHQLTPLALKRSIEAGMILTTAQLDERTGKGSGIPVLHGLTLPFTRWLSSTGGVESIKTWEADRRAEIIRELTPVVEFALALRETLQED